jgi:hypothetical protein
LTIEEENGFRAAMSAYIERSRLMAKHFAPMPRDEVYVASSASRVSSP